MDSILWIPYYYGSKTISSLEIHGFLKGQPNLQTTNQAPYRNPRQPMRS